MKGYLRHFNNGEPRLIREVRIWTPEDINREFSDLEGHKKAWVYLRLNQSIRVDYIDFIRMDQLVLFVALLMDAPNNITHRLSLKRMSMTASKHG